MDQADKRFEVVNQLFADALDLPPAGREAFLRQGCPDMPDMRDSVLRLLSQFERLGDFLETPVLQQRSEEEPEIPPGTLLHGRFEVAGLLGRGGMGEVYRARDLELREHVALKLIRREWRYDSAVVNRFRDEIRLARGIAHPNVCNIHDLFTPDHAGDRLVFFTMEFLEGETLASLLRRHTSLPAERVVAIAGDLAAGLDAAHRQGVIHRDLKPENVMLSGDVHPRAVITDFGLALPTDRLAGAVTQSGVLVGSPDYMAPEQFLGEPLSPATDIFSLAVVIFEMTAGKRPFPADTLLQAAVRRVASEPLSLRAAGADAPRHWERALRRALSRDPRQRPPTAGALVRDLEAKSLAPRGWVQSRRVFGATAVAGAVSGLFAFRRFYERGLPERPVILLVPFTSSTKPLDARALSLQMERGLQQSAYAGLFDRSRIPGLWKLLSSGPVPENLNAGAAREIALRGGADFVLSGAVERTPGEWAVKVTLERMGSSTAHPREAWSEHFYAEDDQHLFGVAGKAIDWVRRIAGESAQEIDRRTHPPEELTTEHWPALREFTAGDDEWKRHTEAPGAAEDRRTAAEIHLKAATRIDPDFAMAMARLADIQMASGQVDEAMENYRSATGILRRRGLTDRESLRIRGLFALDTDNFAEAGELFGQYAAAYPREALPLFYQAGAMEAQGRPEEALPLLDKAIRLEPAVYSYRLTRGIAYLKLGRLAEAERDCDESAQLEGRDWTEQVRGAIAFARFDGRGTEAALDRMWKSGSVAFRGKSRRLLGCLRAEQGRWEEAVAAFEEGVRFDTANGQPRESRLAGWLALARVWLLRGERAQAARICDNVLAAEADAQSVLQAGALLAQAGEVDAARRCLSREKRPPGKLLWPGLQFGLSRLRAEIALAEGDAAGAFAVMEKTRPPNLSLQWPECQVRCAVRAGKDEVAKSRLRDLFARPGAYWLYADVSGPGFLREALESAGRLKMPPGDSASLRRFLGTEG